MAQNSHVPKFGNWDSENVPYTTYFDNARKGKDGKIMNPNDPEENPDLFGNMGHDYDINHHVVQESAPEITHHNKEEGHLRHNSSLRRGVLDQHRTVNRKSITSDSSTDRTDRSDRSSSSDRSLIQQNKTSRRKTSMGEGSNNVYPSSMRSANHRQNDIQSQRVASVPKFGAWDETDAKSGEGFTVIFNKVKQEKQTAANTVPTATMVTNTYSNGQKNRGSSTSRRKICCCLF